MPRSPRSRTRSWRAIWCAAAVALVVAQGGCGGTGGLGSAGGRSPQATGSSTAPVRLASPAPTVVARTASLAAAAHGTPASPAPARPPVPKGAAGAARGATFVFVDVGQGDAIVVKTGAWTGLIDGGPAGAQTVVARVLGDLGVSRLSAVVVTHPHSDHIGGLPDLARKFRPAVAYVGESAGSAADDLQKVGCKTVGVHRGQTLELGALTAKVLSPASLCDDPNEDSVVLLITVGGKRFLFTGDCTGPNEEAVGEICARGPPIYLLKVAHHGSRYSTGATFVAAARPRYAVISVGRNSYGHPAQTTVSTLRHAGARVYSTQNNGTITVKVSAAGVVMWAFAISSAQVTSGVGQ